jgi:hypothetical protein
MLQPFNHSGMTGYVFLNLGFHEFSLILQISAFRSASWRVPIQILLLEPPVTPHLVQVL